MAKDILRKNRKTVSVIFVGLIAAAALSLSGCAWMEGYSNEVLFDESITSVYVEMFENRSFYRGPEYQLTDALVKHIEAETPYKVVSSADRAQTILTGQLTSIGQSALTTERKTGRALEKNATIAAVVNWKDLKTGDLLIDNQNVSASASYSEWQNQGFRYGSALAANNLAQRIVELMEKSW